MTSATTSCPDCTASYAPDDNYCRQCGMYLAALRDVAIVAAPQTAPARIERERAVLPAPVKKAATALAIGTALQIGVGLTGKYLARQAGKQAVNAVRPRAAKPRRAAPAREVTPKPADVRDPYQDAAAISETVVIRRVWIRRP